MYMYIYCTFVHIHTFVNAGFLLGIAVFLNSVIHLSDAIAWFYITWLYRCMAVTHSLVCCEYKERLGRSVVA